jgi:DNA replication protein DnaC
MREQLSELKMNGALVMLDDYLRKSVDNLTFGTGLLDAEIADRKRKTALRKIGNAKFPYERDWSQINLKHNPKINFEKLKQFSDGIFLEQKKNLCFIGHPGLGKSHSLIRIGRDLCKLGCDVLFFTAANLVIKLVEAKAQNELMAFKEKLVRTKLLIVDELGYVPFSEDAARLLFDIFTSRYQVGSIAISTNLAFEKWTQVFGSIELTTALIDRFTHNCEIFVFEGESVRFKEAKKQIICKDNKKQID